MGRRRDAWAYGLAGLDVVAVLVWWPVMLLDGFAPLDVGRWWLLHPALLVLLAFLGFWMWGREWLTRRGRTNGAGRHPRGAEALLP